MADVIYGSAVRGAAHGQCGPVIARCRVHGPSVGPDLEGEDSMKSRDGHQQGPQEHAEGQHGEKAHSRFLEQIHEPMHRDDEASEDDDTSESGRDDRQRR